MDACHMTFEDSSFSIVFDKGTTDALLSGGESDHIKIEEMMSEIFRVLQSGGIFVLITGNDSTVVHPYLYTQDWNVVMSPVERNSTIKDQHNVAFAKLPIWMYVMSKP